MTAEGTIRPMHQAQVALEYPRVYRASLGWALFFAMGGMGITVAGMAGMWYFGSGHEVRGKNDAVMLVTVCLAFVALGLLLLAYLFRSRLVLYADRVELHDLFSVKQIAYDQIEGRRIIKAQNSSSTLVLIERHTGRKMQITQVFRQDEFFLDWICSLPDLDRRDLLESEREIASDVDLGTSEEDRTGALKRARKISAGLVLGTIAAAAWGLLYPPPYELAVGTLIALPWIALFIAWRSNGLFRVDQKKNDAHPSIAIPFMMPGFILMLIVIRGVHVLGVQNAVTATVLIDLLLTGAAAIVDPNIRMKFGVTLLVLGLSAAYGFGAAMGLDVLFDRSVPKVYKVEVVSQYVTHGKTTTHYLVLKPWGSMQGLDRVSVSGGLYRAVLPGQTICVEARQGALKIGWYSVQACQ